MEYQSVKDGLRRAYDANADVREAMVDLSWKVPERERFWQRLRDRGAGSLLEIGAGHGVSGRYYADRGLNVTCVDYSPPLVAHCRAKGLTAHVMDFSRLECDADSFDAVFGMNCLLHVPRGELAEVLASVERVLRPDGLFYWGQYGGREFEGVLDGDEYEPKRFFSFMTDAEIRRRAREFFDVVDFRALEFDDGRGYQALTLTPRPRSGASSGTGPG